MAAVWPEALFGAVYTIQFADPQVQEECSPIRLTAQGVTADLAQGLCRAGTAAQRPSQF